MRAIVTRFLGPTDHRGSRIKADDGDQSVTRSYDHTLNSIDNHEAAALALRKKYTNKMSEYNLVPGAVEKRGVHQFYVWVFVAPNQL